MRQGWRTNIFTNARNGLAPNGRVFMTLREPMGANPEGLRASAMWWSGATSRRGTRGARPSTKYGWTERRRLNTLLGAGFWGLTNI